VAHACSPSYSGGRDQEDRSSKIVWENNLWDPILKISNNTKMAEFEPWYCKKKKKQTSKTKRNY
jgi:hypothetical protein